MEFHHVQTKEELERYCNLWLPLWLESGYELESYITEGIERFIFRLSNTGEEVGCCEFNPYFFDESPVNDDYPFNQFSILKDKRVVELDKLVIRNQFQGSIKRLLEIINFITVYLIDKKYDYAIAFLNPNLYDIFISRFKLPIKKVDFENISNNYIPVIIEINALQESDFGQRAMSKYLQSAI